MRKERVVREVRVCVPGNTGKKSWHSNEWGENGQRKSETGKRSGKRRGRGGRFNHGCATVRAVLAVGTVRAVRTNAHGGATGAGGGTGRGGLH